MINVLILKPRIEKSYPYNYKNKYKLSQKGIKTFKFSNPENMLFFSGFKTHHLEVLEQLLHAKIEN